MLKGSYQDKYLIVYDGDCPMCNWAVRFLMTRDQKDLFRFVPGNSDLLSDHTAITKRSYSSVLLLLNGELFDRSEAVIRIVEVMPGLWNLLGIFRIIPRKLRDYIYDLIARNRDKLFRNSKCKLVPVSYQYKFLK